MHRIIIHSYNPSLLTPDIPRPLYHLIHKLRLFPEYVTTKIIDKETVTYRYIEHSSPSLSIGSGTGTDIDFLRLYQTNSRRLPIILRAVPNTLEFLSQAKISYTSLTPATITIDVSHIVFTKQEITRYNIRKNKLTVIVKPEVSSEL